MAHAATPALNANDGVALVDDAELETVVDSPLEAAVDVLLPDLDIEVGLLLGEEEGPDAAVQVRVLQKYVRYSKTSPNSDTTVQTYASGSGVTGNHQDGADGAVLGKETGGVTAASSVSNP